MRGEVIQANRYGSLFFIPPQGVSTISDYYLLHKYNIKGSHKCETKEGARSLKITPTEFIE